ncbi:MAG TPA: hypothetical protein VM261_13530 [Kofleriaceae bacterium]|nr:hypothetical protein [Kofleriaceae bacterium]
MVKTAWVLMAVGAAAGCVDARGKFDQFADRVGFDDASTVDRAGGSIHDISGTFLFSVRAGFETTNDPAYYIQFILRSELTITGDTAVFNGGVTPLCVVSTCTNGRTEFPPALMATDVPVASDGTFSTTFSGTVPGQANPFSGTQQAITTVAAGTIMSADFYCGDVTGSAAGLNLQGSTFAAIRITDTTPANLPAPIAACPPTSADAGVDAPQIDAAVPDAAPDAMVDAAVDAAVDAETDAETDAPPA